MHLILLSYGIDWSSRPASAWRPEGRCLFAAASTYHVCRCSVPEQKIPAIIEPLAKPVEGAGRDLIDSRSGNSQRLNFLDNPLGREK